METLAARGTVGLAVLYGIERKVQLVGELLRIERAAGKKTIANFYRGNAAAAIVHFNHEVFRVRIFLDIDLVEFDTPPAQKILCPTAIRAPRRAVHRDFFQGSKALLFRHHGAVFARRVLGYSDANE